MAEAVGLASSVVALLDLTTKVAKYLQSVKDAPKDRQRFLAELLGISGLLARLKRSIERRSFEPQEWTECTRLMVFPGGPLERIQSLLMDVTKKLVPGMAGGKRLSVGDSKIKFIRKLTSKVVTKDILWPFQEDEILEILNSIERYKAWLQLGLTNDHVELSRQILGDIECVQLDVTEIKNDVSEITIGVMELHQMQGKQMSDVTEVKQEVTKTQNAVALLDTGIEAVNTAVTEALSDMKCTQEVLGKRIQDSRRQEILEWLSTLNFWPTQNDNFALWEKGTGKWFLETEEFKEWLVGGNRALYCPGIPGAGKTVLTSMVINYMQTEYCSPKMGLAFAYCNYKEQEQQTADNIIRSFLHQLVQKPTEVFSDVFPEDLCSLYDKHTENKTRPTLADYTSLLQNHIPQFKRVFIVIDALDECLHTDREELLAELEKLVSLGNVSLMVTSRDLGTIGDCLLTQSARIEITASKGDVCQYLQSQIKRRQRLATHVRKDPTLIPQIVNTIAAKARGMFLLAKLNMDTVAAKLTLKQIRASLQSLPEGLTNTYDVTMDRIQSQDTEAAELALRVLTWVTCSYRPLTVEELRHALATEPSSQDLDEEALLEEEFIIGVCGGLVAIDGQNTGKRRYTRLVHYTAQEYFDRHRGRLFPHGHTEIATTCIHYLCFDRFAFVGVSLQSTRQRLSEYPFYEYAAKHWGTHARHGSPERLEHLTIHFLKNKKGNLISAMQIVWSATISLYWATSVRILTKALDDAAPILVASSFGILNILKLEIERNHVDCNTRSHSLQTPLSIAAQKGHTDIVQYLLAQENTDADSKDSLERTPLMWAASKGHEDIVAMLLERDDVDPEFEGKKGEAAIALAASQGHDGVVWKLLAKESVNPDSRDDFSGRTTLSWVAGRGNKALVQHLLSREDTNPDLADDDGQTPLSWAASKGQADIVSLLVQRGDVDANSQDDWGQTPLSCAAWGGHLSCVKELLAKEGLQPDLVDEGGQTPLSVAAMEGHVHIASLLLARADVDPNARDNYGQTPLCWAIKENNVEIVRLLVETTRVEIQTQDHNGQTPFHIAAKHGFHEVFQLLLEQGTRCPERFNPDQRDPDGQTPLSRAAGKGRIEVVMLLLDRIDVNACSQDIQGRTPLSWAAGNGREEVVRCLLGNERVRLDMNLPDNKGRTPSYWAEREAHHGIVKMMSRRQRGPTPTLRNN